MKKWIKIFLLLFIFILGFTLGRSILNKKSRVDSDKNDETIIEGGLTDEEVKDIKAEGDTGNSWLEVQPPELTPYVEKSFSDIILYDLGIVGSNFTVLYNNVSDEVYGEVLNTLVDMIGGGQHPYGGISDYYVTDDDFDMTFYLVLDTPDVYEIRCSFNTFYDIIKSDMDKDEFNNMCLDKEFSFRDESNFVFDNDISPLMTMMSQSEYDALLEDVETYSNKYSYIGVIDDRLEREDVSEIYFYIYTEKGMLKGTYLIGLDEVTLEEVSDSLKDVELLLSQKR